MHMSYWFGTDISDFLFKGFTIATTPGFVSICLGLLSLAVLFEALNLGLMATKQEAAITVARSEACHGEPSCEASLLLESSHNTVQCPPRSRLASLLYQIVFFVSRDILSYTLMLCVMTFNAYFTISISLGAGIGFFLFSPLLMEIGLRSNGKRAVCRLCLVKLKRDGEIEGSTSSLSREADTQNTSVSAEEEGGRGERESATMQVSVAQVHSVAAE